MSRIGDFSKTDVVPHLMCCPSLWRGCLNQAIQPYGVMNKLSDYMKPSKFDEDIKIMDLISENGIWNISFASSLCCWLLVCSFSSSALQVSSPVLMTVQLQRQAEHWSTVLLSCVCFVKHRWKTQTGNLWV